MKTILSCPKCHSSSERIAGIEVRGVYDGVLYWQCLECGWAWSRDWTGFGRRGEVAASMVEDHNLRR